MTRFKDIRQHNRRGREESEELGEEELDENAGVSGAPEALHGACSSQPATFLESDSVPGEPLLHKDQVAQSSRESRDAVLRLLAIPPNSRTSGQKKAIRSSKAAHRIALTREGNHAEANMVGPTYWRNDLWDPETRERTLEPEKYRTRFTRTLFGGNGSDNQQRLNFFKSLKKGEIILIDGEMYEFIDSLDILGKYQRVFVKPLGSNSPKMSFFSDGHTFRARP